jgi:hypothetical protein
LLLRVQFAPGEGQRVYDLLDGLGCIGNVKCRLAAFTPTTGCDKNALNLKCDASGRLSYLYNICGDCAVYSI